jgi:hypothetical protein
MPYSDRLSPHIASYGGMSDTPTAAFAWPLLPNSYITKIRFNQPCKFRAAGALFVLTVFEQIPRDTSLFDQRSTSSSELVRINLTHSRGCETVVGVL